MNRLGLLYPSELEGRSKELYDVFYNYVTTRYGKIAGLDTMDKEGRFIGPFGPLLHTPGVGHHFLGLSQTIAQIPGLTPRNREIAILTTGTKFDAAFEVWAHKKLAALAGVLPEQIEEIVEGKRPESLDQEGKAVYDVAHELAHGTGPLSQGAWNKAVELISKDGATQLVQLVGFYSYVSVMLRGFDCRIPSTDE